MSAISSRANPSAVADVPPNREEKRWSSRLVLEKLKQFEVSLKTNARWMQLFLHGRK